MIQKLMWAIKSPHDELVRMEYSDSEHGAWRLWAYDLSVEYSSAWVDQVRLRGYSAVRLQVTEANSSEVAVPELEPSTTTQFVLEMACGKGGRHGYAPISKFGTEPDSRARLDAILARHPGEEWRIMRIDETKTIVYATPERAP